MPMYQSPSVSPTSSRRGGKNGLEYVIHHSKYYLVGGDLFVLIDGVMFKIHSYFFKRESRNFFDDAPLPSSADCPSTEIDERGASESRAIRIPNVTVEEFERFLWVFYNPVYDTYDADIYVWFSILKLAHRWEFPTVTSFALRELKRRESELPLVTRIRLYQEHEAPLEYLVPLFAQLCARETPPSSEEIAELGYEQMCYVWRARELARFPEGVSPLPAGVDEADIYSIVSEVMGIPHHSLDVDEELGASSTAADVTPAPVREDNASSNKQKKKNKSKN